MNALRPLGIFLVLALAGCIDSGGSSTGATTSPTPFHSNGEIWFPATAATGPVDTDIPFLVNGTGMRVMIDIAIAETYGGIQVTGPTSRVEARLFDTDGNVVDEASREALGTMNLKLEARDLTPGECRLALTLQGRSDGSANGDHIAYAIAVE